MPRIAFPAAFPLNSLSNCQIDWDCKLVSSGCPGSRQDMNCKRRLVSFKKFSFGQFNRSLSVVTSVLKVTVFSCKASSVFLFQRILLLRMGQTLKVVVDKKLVLII